MAQARKSHCAYILPINQNATFARLKIVEPVEESENCAFACARLANERNASSRGNFEGDVLQCRGYTVIGEGNIFYEKLGGYEGSAGITRTELHFAILNYQFSCIRRIDHFCRFGKELQQFFGVHEALVDCPVHAAKVREGCIELGWSETSPSGRNTKSPPARNK